MSDIWQGPGWWIASDGKWYPPHLHPSVQTPPPWAPEAPAAVPWPTGTTQATPPDAKGHGRALVMGAIGSVVLLHRGAHSRS